MKLPLSFERYLLLFLLVVVCIAPSPRGKLEAQGPKVLKVEPPSWWPGQSIHPVRVLVRGRDLVGARVETGEPDLSVSRRMRTNAEGTYLFFDLGIDPAAKPGQRALRIVAAGGDAKVPFEILSPLSRPGRFQGFSPDDVIYLLMPDRFSDGDATNDNPPGSHGLFDRRKPRFYHGGDLEGVINHLPYLKDLGVTAIWMTPIYDNVNHLETFHQQEFADYHGYGAVDFYNVDEHFGDLAELRKLVDAAHRQGIKVIQDEVANHTGPDHPWVIDSPTPTWFNGTPANHLNENWQTWTLIDPHATAEIQEPVLEGWFANLLPDLNQNDEEVARYLIQNTLWWIGVTGIDGVRQDTLPYVPRRFWRDWMRAIKREYPRFTVVGEMMDRDPAVVSFFQGGAARGDGIDSRVDTLFDFPLYFAIRRDFGEGKSIRDVAVTLGHDGLYPDPRLLVTFIGLHDVPRFMNEPGASVEGLKLADTFIMTARGIPMIYYGDEIAMRGSGDPDNRRDFPGGWPDDLRNAFRASGRTPEEEEVFQHLRRLAHLRAELEPLRRGLMMNLALGDQTYAYARVTDRLAVVVVINNAPEPETLEFSVAPARLRNGITLQDHLGAGPDVRIKGGKMKVRLPARSAGVYAAKRPS